MEAATWINCREGFSYDGAFVDLIVPGTGVVEWRAFWAAVRSGPFGLRAYRDGEIIPLPETATSIFVTREEASVSVSVLVGNVTANCHFFGGDLQLDIDPREVDGEMAFESVLGLMRFIAAALKLPVLAVPEGGNQERAFLRVSPDGQALFCHGGKKQ